jgi:hypothetical protein
VNAQRHLLLLVTLAAISSAAAMSPAAAQQHAPQAASFGGPTVTSVPDFSGIWRHGNLPWFIPPASGPGPVTNLSREKGTGVSDYSSLVGDYKNPILQPWAAEVVRKHGEISLTRQPYPTPSNQCWPGGVPFVLYNVGMQMFQQPDRVTIIYSNDHEIRRVRLNQPHPQQVTPTWYGDSVGHYEGDTLVIDTVGIKVGPFAMLDMYGTPHSEAMHVVERYRLLDNETARRVEAQGQRGLSRLGRDPGFARNPNDKDPGLQLEFTVEDNGVFTAPWSGSISYRRPLDSWWPEMACAENSQEYFSTRPIAVPTADKTDF